ncbi:hypothetical protein ANN_15314 [Periplaneta americana]|uniref:Uncharacterized protein n=1 Tax=Periplaneta americana TaxID=6978 RepID=A0ABQ8SH99_PERAM|nr:hypothetical protein ANN_15314 [Periplaneta americana]
MKKKSKREQEYENRYRDNDPHLMQFEPPCQHKEGRFRCCSIPINALCKAKRTLFANPNKKQQDMRLSFLLDVNSPKRQIRRKKIPVCARFFRKLFSIGQIRVNTISKGIASGKGVIDKRGGDHKVGKFEARRKEVVKFISKLKGTESHYNRSKSQRLYLSSDLSVNKLFKMYSYPEKE